MSECVVVVKVEVVLIIVVVVVVVVGYGESERASGVSRHRAPPVHVKSASGQLTVSARIGAMLSQPPSEVQPHSDNIQPCSSHIVLIRLGTVEP